MKTILSMSLTGLTIFTNINVFSSSAQASFGDFLLGAGVAAGVSAIIDSNARRDIKEQYKSVSPQEEYYRGVQDGINGAKYDNPRNSADYDEGYQKGLSERNER